MQTLTPAYVQRADGNVITVVLLDGTAHAALQALGFSGAAPDLHIEVSDEAAKAQLFAALRDLGVAFAAGREWCPAEVFDWLRERGLLSGRCQRIAWSGPQKFHVTQE